MFNKLSIKSLLIVFGLLAVVVLVMFLSEGNDRSYSGTVIEYDTTAVDKIVIQPRNKSIGEVELFKDANQWYVKLTNGKNAKVQNAEIKSIFNQTSSLQALRMVAKSEKKHKKYEVDTVGTRVKFYSGSSLEADLIIGKFTYTQPKGGGMQFNQQNIQMKTYVRPGDEDEVYQVGSFLEVAFNKDANGFRDKRLINSPYEKWNSLTFLYPADSSFTMTKLGGKWMIEGTVADSAEVVKYFRQIANLNGNNVIDKEYDDINKLTTHTLKISGEDGDVIVSGFEDGENFPLYSSYNPGTIVNGNKYNLKNKLFVSKHKFLIN